MKVIKRYKHLRHLKSVMMTSKTTVVVSLGGSVINPQEPDVKTIRTLAKVFNSFKGRLGIVTGGGSYARVYANAVRELSRNEFLADEVAILETRQNAQLIISALKDVCPYAPEDFKKATSLLNTYKTVVMGGTIPGITSDADAVMLAEVVKAKRIVNISNIDAVYDRDPRQKGARKLPKMTHAELVKMAERFDKRKAGTHFIFDVLAAKLAARSGIEVHFVNKEAKNVKAALEGKRHKGTIVRG